MAMSAVLGFGVPGILTFLGLLSDCGKNRREFKLAKHGCRVAAVGTAQGGAIELRYTWNGEQVSKRFKAAGAHIKAFKAGETSATVLSRDVALPTVQVFSSDQSSSELTLLTAGLLVGFFWAVGRETEDLFWWHVAIPVVAVLGCLLSLPLRWLYHSAWVANNTARGLSLDLSMPTDAEAGSGAGAAAGLPVPTIPASPKPNPTASSARSYSELLAALNVATSEGDAVAVLEEMAVVMEDGAMVMRLGGVPAISGAVQQSRARAEVAGLQWTQPVAMAFGKVVVTARESGDAAAAAASSAIPAIINNALESRNAAPAGAAAPPQASAPRDPKASALMASEAESKAGPGSGASGGPPARPAQKSQAPGTLFVLLTLGLSGWLLWAGAKYFDDPCKKDLAGWALVTGSARLVMFVCSMSKPRLGTSTSLRLFLGMTCSVWSTVITSFLFVWTIVGAVWYFNRGDCESKLETPVAVTVYMFLAVIGLAFLLMCCFSCCAARSRT